MGVCDCSDCRDMENTTTITWIEYLAKLCRNLESHRSSACFQKIISALRGPDCLMVPLDGDFSLFRLKQLTTGRIRAIVAPAYCGDVTKDKLTSDELVERDLLLKHSPTHFYSHYYEAVEAIRIVYGYDLRYERECSKHEHK